MQDFLNKPQDVCFMINLLKEKAQQGDGNAMAQIAELFVNNLQDMAFL